MRIPLIDRDVDRVGVLIQVLVLHVTYACAAYQTVLRQHQVVCSMSRRGDCWDNAVGESFFASFKVERLHERKYATVEQLRAEIADYIERFYNRQRRHSTLGYLSPAIYEPCHAA